jgi:uncharacterized protein involved in exopolysaccharide biosynthesis
MPAPSPSSGDSPTVSGSTPESAPAPPDESAPENDRAGTYVQDEVSLVDGILLLARRKILVVKTAALFLALGFAYAVLAPTEYTSSARVVRETPMDASSLPGGLAALSSGLGISLGGAASGLTPEAYPSILTSREVRLSVVRDTFYFPDEGRRMTYVAYTELPEGIGETVIKYTLKLPWTLKKIIAPAPKRPVGTDASGSPIYPTEAEEEAIDDIKSQVSSSVDVESGLMTISFTAGDPGPAAEIAQSFLDHLTQRIRTIRTDKSRQTLEFIRERYREAQEELRTAEEELAAFTDRNQSINSARLRTEQDRLERQVRFASNLYGDLQKQLTQAQIELQRNEPVITTVEQPVPPIERSAPMRTVAVLFAGILGVVFGVIAAMVTAYFDDQGSTGPEQDKIREIRERLHLNALTDFKHRIFR